jgi:glycosyltransferase involved in cell wall biosynthesis
LKKKPIYFVVSHPIQYMVPLYQELEKDETLDVRVFYCSDETLNGSIDKQFGVKIKWDIPLLDGYKFEFLKNNSWKPSINNGFFGIINFSIISRMWKIPKGFVIINGWMSFTYILTFFFAKLFRHKVAIRCEAPFFKESVKGGIKQYIRFIFLKWILFKVFIDTFLYIGNQNKKFYEHFGVSSHKLFFTPYAVDNSRFQQLNLFNTKDRLRRKLSLENDYFIVLFTGKFYDVKRPLDLILAYEKMTYPSKRLVMVGDGVMKKDMETIVKERNIQNVNFPGFKNQSEIPDYYAVADVLVLCSESETWGLSVNEAMNFKLPIIVYNTVGCADNLVEDNKNGFIIPKGDICEIAKKLDFLAYKTEFSKTAGEESYKLVKNYSILQIINGIKLAVNA